MGEEGNEGAKGGRKEEGEWGKAVKRGVDEDRVGGLIAIKGFFFGGGVEGEGVGFSRQTGRLRVTIGWVRCWYV